MRPGVGRKYAICFALIVAGVLASAILLGGPLRNAGESLTGPATEKVAKGKAGGEHGGSEGNLYLLIFFALTIYGAHLAARFLSDGTWRRKDEYVREVRWSVVDVMALALLFLALAGTYNAISPASSGGSGAAEGTTVGETVVITFCYVIVLVFGAWILKQKGCNFAEGMGLSRQRYGRLILVGVVAFLAFQPIRLMYTTGVVAFFYEVGLPIRSHPVVKELLKPDEVGLKLSLAMSVAVSAPFFEEIFFRGFFYQAVRKRMDAWAAIAITAGLFASIHEGVFQMSLIFPLGLLLAYLMEKTGSVIPCMVVHFLVNGTTLLTFLVAG